MATLNFTFKLKDPKADKPTPIYLVSYVNYQRFKFSTGQKIEPGFWDKENDFPLEKIKGNPDQTRTNKKIIEKISEVKSIFLEIERKTDEILTPEILKNLYDEKTGNNQKQKLTEAKKKSLKRVSVFLDQFVEDIKQGRRVNSNTGKLIKPETIKDYNLTKNQIIGFENTNRVKLDFNDLTVDWYKDFLNYLNKKGYSPNYSGRIIKTVKVILREANKLKLTENRSFESREFKRLRENTDQIYLSENELTQIYELNLNYIPNLDRARDLFLIACWTGLRVSDLKKLKPENFDFKNGFIRINTTKTDTPVVIPMHWTILEILKKHNYTLPPVISPQKLNVYVKNICEAAMINEPIQFSKTRGGLRFDTTIEKFNLVSMHTARRSFATNLYKQKIPAAQIMLMTGHKSEKVFLQYIRVTPEENAELLKNHRFFLNPLKIAK